MPTSTPAAGDPVTNSSHPSLAEISAVFAHLSDRVSAEPDRDLDPIVTLSLQRALIELRRFIPGLDTPPDPHAARFFASGARAALESGLYRDALARALRGLSFAPHDPNLFHLAGCACLELGSVRDSMDLMLHALWIHPGHPDALRDLQCLSALGGVDPDDEDDLAGRPGDPLEGWQMIEDGAAETMPFEFADDIEGGDDLFEALDDAAQPDATRDARDGDDDDADDDQRRAA
jgi:hypothetical protein